MSNVCQAFAKEEAASYHIHLPRFIAHFIYGLFLCPISWVIRKGKGQLVIDASTMLTPDDTGAPNSYIPKAGMPGVLKTNVHTRLFWQCPKATLAPAMEPMY
jgi:hypothetical protein